MNSKEFLKKKLEELSSNYPNTTIKYYFDEYDNDHFVCIFPQHDLETIIDNEAMAIDRIFIKKYPSESLSFIEIDDNLMFDELVFAQYPILFNVQDRTEINFNINFSTSIKYLQMDAEAIVVSANMENADLIIEQDSEEFAFAA